MMSEENPTFVPTQAELDLMHDLDSGGALPFPEDIKVDFSERLYENGFLTVGVDGVLALSDRGRELLAVHSHTAPA